MSSARCRAQCTPTKTHTTKRQVNGIHTYTSSHWWIVGLISRICQYWHSITGDSYIVDVRRAKKEKGTGYAGAAAEVCKYALKFGDLSVEHTWEAFKILKGRRLTGSFGLLWGVKIPEKATDDLPDDQSLPYLEMLYKFNYGKHSYYDLIVTRNVEPKAKAELGGGGATTTDRRCEAEALATKDEARTERSGAATQEWNPPRTDRNKDAKKPTGESHLLPVFGFGNESEDGTDIYIILTYSRMLSIGY